MRFEVTGGQHIHCAGCEERIVRAMSGFPGVRLVQASAASQQVMVTFDAAQVSAAALQARLARLGYRVGAGGGAV